MEFDWRGAIDRNCEILCDIAFRLIVMAGIEAGRTAETLPRHLYLRILAILRPAEFATRRLIAMAACKLVTITMRPSERRRRPPTQPNHVRWMLSAASKSLRRSRASCRRRSHG